MFGRSKKIEKGALLEMHTILADAAQDAIERLVKERVRWVGVTVRFTHTGPCKNGEKYKAVVRGYCRKFETKSTHGVEATFKVCVYGITNTVVFEEDASHKLAFEFRHEYWDHYNLRTEANGSILIRRSSVIDQEPWVKADGTQVVLPELPDL